MSLGDLLLEKLEAGAAYSKKYIMDILEELSLIPTFRFIQGRTIGIGCGELGPGVIQGDMVVGFEKQEEGTYRVLHIAVDYD